MDTKKNLGRCSLWGLGIFSKKYIFFNSYFHAIFSYDSSRFYFWALGVPLLVGPWGLGLGLGLGSGLGFSIPMDCTGGPLQDALVCCLSVE